MASTIEKSGDGHGGRLCPAWLMLLPGAARIGRSRFSCVNDAMSHTAAAPANAQKRYNVHRADLPLSCPTPEMALWNSHPRVYLPIEDEPSGEAACPYCGAVFVLVD